MPKRNYGYEKRQKELTRQRKQEEKRQRKLDRTEALPPEPVRPDDSDPPGMLPNE